MQDMFRAIAAYADLACELAAVGVLILGAVEALVGVALATRNWSDFRPIKRVWARFASWLILGLEFTIAGDVIRTAIAPSWNDIGQLAAIAAIRTALNWFLERDVEAYVAPEERGETLEPTK
jgi:uncharacterized membrane protein